MTVSPLHTRKLTIIAQDPSIKVNGKILRTEVEIPAEGELGVQMFYSKVPWDEDRFAEIVELKPSNRAVLTFFRGLLGSRRERVDRTRCW